MKKIIVFFLLLTFEFLYSQNLISVPFNNGFVGNNTGNNSSSNAYYLSGGLGLGWTNVQFAQNSSGNVFVAQGNDIIGMVLITDANGVEHTINGFIKWRTPSGNSPNTPVFQPATGTNITLATNGFNGASTYLINDTRYIGLTFNGTILDISPVPGTVTGNAATNGLLELLNDYLASLTKISIQDVTVVENIGSVTVTISLSVASTNTITVNFETTDGTAIAGTDYTATTGMVTFTPGQTSRTISIPILDDTLQESTETFNIILSDATNAAILDGTAIITITDNDTCVVNAITLNNISVNEADSHAVFDVQGPSGSFASLYLQNVTALGDGVDYGSLNQSNIEYSIDNGVSWLPYGNFVSFPNCIPLKVRTPIIDDTIIEANETFKLLVKPISVNLNTTTLHNVNYQALNFSGLTLISGSAGAVNARYRKTNTITINGQAIDAVITIIARTNVTSYTFDNDNYYSPNNTNANYYDQYNDDDNDYNMDSKGSKGNVDDLVFEEDHNNHNNQCYLPQDCICI